MAASRTAELLAAGSVVVDVGAQPVKAPDSPMTSAAMALNLTVLFIRILFF